MGFLDKAKAQATAAMAQGQAKVGAIQQGRTESDLYKTLGESFYRQQRQGGDGDSVEAALGALDGHFAQVAQVAQAAATQAAQAAATPTYAPPPGQAATPPPGGGTTPAPGNFTLDDM